MALLAVQHISKQLSGKLLVRDINFEQQAFQKIAIAGASGAGKTTLLKIISGHLQPDSGTVLFDGRRVPGPDEKLLPGHKEIAYLSQHYELLNNYRVEELIWFENRLAIPEAEALFEICRISHLLQRRTNQLSGGEKQRIALCMLLVNQPRLLVMDEPFSNLDPVHTDVLKTVLEAITERLQITCMLTSHDPHDTLPWADKILVMQAGEIIQQGSPPDLYHRPVNEYVAGLFGKYSLLSPAQALWFGIETNSRNVLLRPEEFRITAAAGKSVKGVVQKISFWGSYYEAAILIGGISILSRFMENEWEEGQYVGVEVVGKN